MNTTQQPNPTQQPVSAEQDLEQFLNTQKGPESEQTEAAPAKPVRELTPEDHKLVDDLVFSGFSTKTKSFLQGRVVVTFKTPMEKEGLAIAAFLRDKAKEAILSDFELEDLNNRARLVVGLTEVSFRDHGTPRKNYPFKDLSLEDGVAATTTWSTFILEIIRKGYNEFLQDIAGILEAVDFEKKS